MSDLTLESCGVPPWEKLVEIYLRFEEHGSMLIRRRKYAVSSAGLERPEPFWLERAGRRPAVLLDEAPRDRRGAVRYAFGPDATVPVVSEFYGDDEQLATVWLRWMINRSVFTVRFSLADRRPEPVEVIVEGISLQDRLEEVVAFTDEGQRIRREAYRYDASERVVLIELTEGTPAEVLSKSVVEASFGEAGPTFAERRLLAGEDFPPRPEPADDRTVPTPRLPSPSVVEAAANTVALLSAAVASWYERAPQSTSITRILLLHDWPVNPPFPPALVARSGPWSSEEDPHEFFDPEPEVEAWFDTGPHEFRDIEIEVDAETLNAWFIGGEPERSPFDLFVEIARATRLEIEKRTGRDVWVLPIDYGLTEAGRAVEALLEPDVSAPMVAALRAAETDG